jgi:hypothetical protein
LLPGVDIEGDISSLDVWSARRFQNYLDTHELAEAGKKQLILLHQKIKQHAKDLNDTISGTDVTQFLYMFQQLMKLMDEMKNVLQSNFDTFIVNQEGGDSFQTRKLELNVFKDKASKFNWDSDVMKKLLQMWINMPIFLQTDKVRFMAIDLLLLRPCIEHYMLAVIMGRGGGPEELGATFWGQTEISCYDDSQHGIWGMSYKYHERAIVLNERNLIRVFDVCFDGYCGNDSHILEWNVDKVQRFRDKLTNVTDQYDGPNFIVMGLPPGQSGKMFPNPLVLQSKSVNGAALGTCCPDRSLPANDVHKYQYFKGEDIQVQIYDKYLRFTGLHELPNNALHSFENANETGSGNLTSF